MRHHVVRVALNFAGRLQGLAQVPLQSPIGWPAEYGHSTVAGSGGRDGLGHLVGLAHDTKAAHGLFAPLNEDRARMHTHLNHKPPANGGPLLRQVHGRSQGTAAVLFAGAGQSKHGVNALPLHRVDHTPGQSHGLGPLGDKRVQRLQPLLQIGPGLPRSIGGTNRNHRD